MAAEAGTTVDRLPRIVAGDTAAGRVRDGTAAAGALLGGGTIDAFAEQLVAGADDDGDVLVICGTTLITWAVVPDWREVPGLWTVPHTRTGQGPGRRARATPAGSSSSGCCASRVRRRPAGVDGRSCRPTPVGCRCGPRTSAASARRCTIRAGGPRSHDLDLTHDAAAVRRAAYEAAGFVVRHHLDLAGVDARRIVATGGGVRSTAWVQALADATGLPVDVVAVPEGAALGAAFTARVIAGLETSAGDARRWARTAARVEPDPAWTGPTADRYARFRQLTATA